MFSRFVSFAFSFLRAKGLHFTRFRLDWYIQAAEITSRAGRSGYLLTEATTTSYYLDARREEQNQEIEGEMIFVSQ